MKKSNAPTRHISRRNFVGSLGTAVTSIIASSTAFAREASPKSNWSETEEWFKKIKGSHRIVYDATSIHDGFSIVWSWVFLDSNHKTGSKDEDLTSIVVFRHNAFALALGNEIWSAYKLGKLLKIADPFSGIPVATNPYWDPAQGVMPESDMSIKMLMERGVMFCVCDRSLSMNSAVVARKRNLNAEKVKAEWIDGLLPGIQVVPSGVWAINRAQEHGCSYCFAG
jgi:intracellular sulfur oxidation DsrE/DsrF family protein